MEKQTVKFDYGSFGNFTYVAKTTDIDLTWDAPADLEPKYRDVFNKAVRVGIADLEKQFLDGVRATVDQLKKWDKQIGNVVAAGKKKEKPDPKDLAIVSELGDSLPKIIEGQVRQKEKIFESMFDKILAKAIDTVNSKLKLKITLAKVKKGLKIAAVATLVVAGIALSIAATVVTFGAAAPSIVAAVGVGVGALGSMISFGKQAHGIWGEGKNEAKNMEAVIAAFAKVAADYDAIMKRQVSQVTAKKGKLDAMKSEIVKIDTQIKTLNTLSGKIPEAAAKIAPAEAAFKKMMQDYLALANEVKEQSALVQKAAASRDFTAATQLAAKLKEDRGILDKVVDGAGTVSNFLGIASSFVGKYA